MENQDLDKILNGEVDPDAIAPPVEAAAAVETVETAPRDDKGRFAPKGDTEEPAPQATAPPAVSEDVEGPTVPRKALQDERSKRQTLEDQLQQMQRQLDAVQNPPEPPPSLWDDTPGWQEHFGKTVVSEAVTQATFNARLDMSEMMTRQAHPDFEAKKAVFIEAMKTTPGLQQRAQQDPHPWNFAYQYVANQERMQELSAVNVADLEAKLRAQIKAEYEANAQSALNARLPAGVPPSLSQERNVGSRQGPAWSGPATLGDILTSTAR